MINPKTKMSVSTREMREDEHLSIPTLQNQASERALTPPQGPERLQHDTFWKETVLYWNRSGYRFTLIEYIPCLMGLVFNEETMGRIENLNSFPLESQHYFVQLNGAQRFYASKTAYHKLFRAKKGPRDPSARRMSEPEINGARPSDSSGISQDSFLFKTFLDQVLRTTKISCTVLILSLKFAQLFLRRIKLLGNPYCSELDSNQFRLFVTSLLFADKLSEDHPYTNKSWSTLSGLSIPEVNLLERTFLAAMQHHLFMSESEFRDWTKSLQNLCKWETINLHQPEQVRLFNLSSSAIRRMSYSNENEHIQDKSDSSASSMSVHVQDEPEKVSFWSRFRFYRK